MNSHDANGCNGVETCQSVMCPITAIQAALAHSQKRTFWVWLNETTGVGWFADGPLLLLNARKQTQTQSASLGLWSTKERP